MILPQELRIGNIIDLHIEGADYWVNGRVLSSNDIQCIESGATCNGIPLTEEWLIMFGFENMNDKDIKVYCKSFGEFDGEDFSDAICISLDAKGNWYFSLGRKVVCNYVHHAQNLYFALTGQELTIKENVV